MKPIATPGVYIEELNAFPNSVVAVPTAIPAFVGYTQKAINNGQSLTNKPVRIESLADYRTYFGGAPTPEFSIKKIAKKDLSTPDFTFGTQKYKLTQENEKYRLYYSLELFFNNGGGSCYMVSVGDYNTPIDANRLISGIDTLTKEQEPSLLVIPETCSLPNLESAAAVNLSMQNHCGFEMKNRLAIHDIWQGFRNRKDQAGDPIDDFRKNIGTDFLSYGAAYYPWLNTNLIQDNDLSFLNIKNRNVLKTIVTQELLSAGKKIPEEQKLAWSQQIGKIGRKKFPETEKNSLNTTLITISQTFKTILQSIKQQLNLLPPGSAMAGIYTVNDNTCGVWNAPANVGLVSVQSPSVNISQNEQEELNVPVDGKSINAIRFFAGRGILVWGARTLDGNSTDWRYINVRRTLIMLEESIKMATKAYIFEPNVHSTWATIISTISNFLTSIWKQGGLMGASAGDAFDVEVGLGQTMTGQDILDGIMRVRVLVAIARPAEFIEITFEQQLPQS